MTLVLGISTSLFNSTLHKALTERTGAFHGPRILMEADL